MDKRYFTIEEARRLLPIIRELVRRAILLTQQMEEYRPHVEKFGELASHNSGGPEGTAYLNYLLRLQSVLNEIQEKGCLVKNIREGLIDFPHLKDGREVYLCWKFGEEDIQFWHEVDAGFAGRTPLLD